MVMPNYGRADVFTKAELRNMAARYKAELEMVSKWIGFVIRQIKDVGIYDESLIIFTSDHGIYLGEHNRTGKLNITKTDPRGPWPLYEELIHVPFLVKMPGQEYRGKTISELVQPTDILPTVLEMAGINSKRRLPGKAPLPYREIAQELKGIMYGREKGLNPLYGKSLLPIIRGEVKNWDREYIFSSQRLGFLNENFSFSLVPEKDTTLFWITVTGKEHALVVGGREEDPPELYDIRKDPKQEKNVFSQKRRLAKKMVDALSEGLVALGANKDRVEVYRSRVHNARV